MQEGGNASLFSVRDKLEVQDVKIRCNLPLFGVK